MKIHIIAVGKSNDAHINALYERYIKRCSNKIIITEVLEKRPLRPLELKQSEASLILKKIPLGAKIIALDLNGQNIDSPAFAKMLQSCRQSALKNVAFIIGGAFGLDEGLLKKAHKSISFGKMTFPHMLVRIIIAEQLYRAEQILNSHPYHK